MDKKGQFGISLGLGKVLIPAVITIILVFAIIFSERFRMLAISISLIALGILLFTKDWIKNEKVKVFLPLGFIAVGLILLVSGGVLNSIGFQPLSITDADYNNGKILVYASTQGANALDITFSPSVLNSFLEDSGVKATKTSKLTAQVISHRASFNYVTNLDNPIKSIEKFGTVSNVVGGRLSECKQVYPDTEFTVVEGLGFFNVKVGCYGFVNEGYINSFSTGQVKSDNKIQFNLDGEIKTISSDNTKVNFNGATITWRGNLISNTFISSPQYEVYRIGNNIRLVKKGAGSESLTEFKSLENCVSREMDAEDFKICKNNYESRINSILSDKNSEYVGNAQGVSSIDTISNGVMKIDLDSPNFIPTFTIELDAEKVGIVKLSGQPKILDCADDISQKGSGSGNEKITIKNTGESDGYFVFETTTNNPKISCQINPISINDGKTKTLDVFYSGSITSEADTTGTCSIKVYDSNDRDNSDSCNFGIKIEYEPFTSDCNNEGETKCSSDGRSVLTCKNGFYESILCNISCIVEDNKAVCSSIEPEETCGFFEQAVTVTEKDYGVGYWRAYTPFFDPIESQVDECRLASWVSITGILVVVLILGLVAVSQMSSGKRGKKR